MWRHISIAVVQRVRSNIWHFKFEMPTYGGSNQLFMKNRSDYHDHQDIYIYNPSGPKRFTLDVPNQGDYSDGICQTSRQDESWRCSDCNTNSQHFSWLQENSLLSLTGRRIVTTLFDLNKMFQTTDWNYFVKLNFKNMLIVWTVSSLAILGQKENSGNKTLNVWTVSNLDILRIMRI